MNLYHGSNVEVREPALSRSRRNLDFGAAFYLTSDLDQAQRWARRTARLRNEGRAIITSFELDGTVFSQLRVRVFESAAVDWLRYVARNRTEPSDDPDCDVVIGPVANDQTIRTVNDYILGRYPEDVAIRLLLPQKLKDQYAFKTDAALGALRYVEVTQA